MKVNKLANYLRTNSTDAEKKLWNKLRNKNLGVRFRRQHPIDNFIVDFICTEKNLIVELDGGQHNFKNNAKKDNARTKILESKGYKVIRFWNFEINENINGVLETIFHELEIE